MPQPIDTADLVARLRIGAHVQNDPLLKEAAEAIEGLTSYMKASADSLDAARIARANGAVFESHILGVVQAEAERLRFHAATTEPTHE